MILAVTGHRPNKLGGYGPEATRARTDFAIKELLEINPKQVITGMALGWDQAIAEACYQLKIPYVAAVPFLGQERNWPQESQKYYEIMCKLAKEVVVVCSGLYSPYKMQIRNEWMVNNADKLLALYNNGPTGGTANCVNYAKRVMGENNIINCWDRWEKCYANS